MNVPAELKPCLRKDKFRCVCCNEAGYCIALTTTENSDKECPFFKTHQQKKEQEEKMICSPEYEAYRRFIERVYGKNYEIK